MHTIPRRGRFETCPYKTILFLVCRHINYKLYIVDNFSYIAPQNSIYMFRY
jgi:hypothetical protein